MANVVLTDAELEKLAWLDRNPAELRRFVIVHAMRIAGGAENNAAVNALQLLVQLAGAGGGVVDELGIDAMTDDEVAGLEKFLEGAREFRAKS